MPTTTETVIVAALKSGNLRRAVELLLDSYQEELFAYCARLVGSEQASLIYQRVLSLALENMDSLDGTPSVRAWLFRLARAIILQFHRTLPGEFEGALGDAYAPVTGPALAAPAAPARPAIPGRLERLEPAALEVLQLALWHGLLLFEVAHVLERGENEVRQLASRALSVLALETPDGSAAPS